MATPTITPEVSVSPSAPVATPAVPTPAPVTAPEQSNLERMNAAVQTVNQEIGKIDAEPEAAPVAEAAAPEVPAVDVAAPDKEAAPADAPTADADAAKTADLPELDDGQTIAPSALAKMINESPELKAYFDNPDNQVTKNKWFAMARRLEKGGEVLQLIPSADEARNLIATSGEFQNFDDGLEAVNSPETGLQFFDLLHDAFTVDDGKGGKTVAPGLRHIRRGIFNDGIGFLMKESERTGSIHPALPFDQMLEILNTKATRENNDNLRLAVEALREEYPAGSRPQRVELTPEQKARDAEITRREQDLNRQQVEKHTQDVKVAYDGAEQLAIQSAVDQARPRFEKAGLSKAEQELAFQKLGESLFADLQNNGLYTQRLKTLKANLERNPSPENALKVREHMIEYQNLNLGKIISDVLNASTEGKVTRQAARDTKVAAQVDASKAEPSGGAAVPTGPKKQTPAQERAESETIWAKDNPGEDMPVAFHMQRMSHKIKAEMAR